jgi:transposase-like protein
MREKEITIQQKEAIATEYLLGETTYRKLGEKYGVRYQYVYRWVSKYHGGFVKKKKPKIKSRADVLRDDLPTDVKKLQKELVKAKLHNELLNAMIDIAEDQLKIDIRKKSGTKQ